MSNILLFTFIISMVVIVIMIKQINKVTQNIDNKSIQNQPSVYAKFSAIIQEQIRAIKADIDHTKDTPNPTYILINESEEESSLEFLADNIRKLVFFETLNAKRKNSKDIESELFGILNSLDEFLNTKIQNGDTLANNLREEFSQKYKNLQ